ncbi:MAG: hypothetical protein EB015_14420 [Methylocystaceae bacterium]|nr:hypothetical protein [Methylocystaceae bacterium]
MGVTRHPDHSSHHIARGEGEHYERSRIETPRHEPEILPPHSSGDQRRDETFVFMSGPEVMRFRIKPISPFSMFLLTLGAFGIIFLILTLFAGAFLISLPIVAGLVVIGFTASILRRLFR